MKFKNFRATQWCLYVALLMFFACKKESDYVAQQSSSSSNVTDDQLVLTPAGQYPKSHVHFIESGNKLVIMNGRVQKINSLTGTVIEDFGTYDKKSTLNYLSKSPQQKKQNGPIPNFNTGWITYAYWTNSGSTPISYMQTTWKVPTAPVSHDGQTLFLFNGMQDAYVGTDIIQPVLQWGVSAAGGGAYWAIASWCVIGSQAYYTALTTVSAGTSLTGILQLNSYSGTAYNYTVSFSGYATTKLIVSNGVGSNTGGNALPQQRFACHTLETYNIVQGSDYPADKSDAMKSIQLKTGTTYPTITWTANSTNADPAIGQKTVIVSNNTSGSGEIDIYFHPSSVQITGTTYFGAGHLSSGGYINATPGTAVNVNVGAGGPPPGPYTTTFGMTGATFTDGSTGITVSYPPTGSASKSFTMPANGYVNWSGSFSEPNSDGSGSVSVN